MKPIQYTPSPATADIDFLCDKINAETSNYPAAQPFGFFIRDETEQIIAGCNGILLFGSIYTDQLWVAPEHRKQGLAQQLMERVHALGQEKGFKVASLNTMNFQGAVEFYEKLGYRLDFERPGYAKGSRLLFLSRDL